MKNQPASDVHKATIGVIRALCKAIPALGTQRNHSAKRFHEIMDQLGAAINHARSQVRR